MATGLPVVPIVIRNSESVAGRNSTTLHPGTVDVAVLPPVEIGDWTHDNLGERIEQIRSAYVALLAEWPTGPAGPAAGLRGLRGLRAFGSAEARTGVRDAVVSSALDRRNCWPTGRGPWC